MKKSDVELVINTIDNIKSFTDKLDFNTSKYINQQVIQVMPILKDELDRLENAKTTINSPKLLVFCSKDIDTEQTLIDYANTKMAELVENKFKIIDFGLYDNNTHEMYVYIKYTD